jgi:hypothetical protein
MRPEASRGRATPTCAAHLHSQECRGLERQAARAQASLAAEREERDAAKASCAKAPRAS